ncbi:MAG: SRPBCC family protein [Acidimicrobiales bacterium]
MSGVDKAAKQTSASRIIHAQPGALFDVLVDPTRHAEFDGSDTVEAARGKPARLELGSRFGMSMTLKPIPYMISSTVVEFVENERIAWHHLGRHRWRYELESVEGGTLVTETFDWSTSVVPFVIERAGYPERHLGNIERTLANLARLVESPTP